MSLVEVLTGTRWLSRPRRRRTGRNFRAVNRASIWAAKGISPRFGSSLSTTLETHYSPGKGMQIHQPQPEADEATDFSLKAAKIRDVVWGMKNDKRTRIKSAKDGTEGYILSRTVERFGRPVAFVFSGATPHQDGSS